MVRLSMSAYLRVQVPLRAGHSAQSETQLHESDRVRKGIGARKSWADEQEPQRKRCLSRVSGHETTKRL